MRPSAKHIIWHIGVYSALSGEQLVYASSCSAKPLLIPVTNNTIRDGIISYGSGATLGGQKFSLRIIDSEISSFFGIPAQCINTTDPRRCATTSTSNNILEVLRGGLYDQYESKTYTGPLSSSAVNITTLDANGFANMTYGTDTAILGDTQIPSFPFKLSPENAETNWGELGLGPGSYALSALESMGRIPSQVWGFFGGWTGLTVDTIQNGGTVLGGYDKSKVAGSFQEFDMTHDSRGCNLRVTVSDIRVSQSNGVSQSIFSNGLTLDACISTSYELMTLPQSIVSNLASVMNVDLSVRTFGYFLYGFTISSDVADDFSLVFTLANGQQIEIPNHQLIQPNVQVTQTGYSILNESTQRTVRINSLQDTNANDNSQLGWPFLSGVYLLVDHEQDKFSIAPAVKSVVSTTNLVPITRTTCTATTTSSTTTSPPISSQTTFNTSVGSSKVHKSSSTVPIIAGVVGGVVAVAVLCMLIYVVRRKRKSSQPQSIELPGLNSDQAHEADGRQIMGQNKKYFHEAWIPLQSPKELPAELHPRDTSPSQHQVYEL